MCRSGLGDGVLLKEEEKLRAEDGRDSSKNTWARLVP